MDKTALLKKLDAMLDEYARLKSWGTIEIEIRDGQPNYIRQMKTEKLAQETTRAHQANYSR